MTEREARAGASSEGAGRPMRVLVVRLSALGDCVHALPAVRRLCAHPQVQVGWAIERGGWLTVRDLAEVSWFHHFPRRARGRERWTATARFRSQMRSVAYDALLDLQGNAKSAWVSWLSGASLRLGPEDGRELNGLAHHQRYPVGRRRHVTDRHLDAVDHLLERLDLAPVADGPTGAPAAAPLDAASSDSSGEALRAPPGGRAVLCPATTWETKHWPVDHYAVLAGRLVAAGWQVEVFWGGAAERELAEVLRRMTDGAATPVPDLSLDRLATYLGEVQLIVGNDTGPVHLGADLGVPTVSIHGPTPVWRNGAAGSCAQGIELHDPALACRPCWKGRCARGDLACLERLSPDVVLRACSAALSRNAESSGRQS